MRWLNGVLICIGAFVVTCLWVMPLGSYAPARNSVLLARTVLGRWPQDPGEVNAVFAVLGEMDANTTSELITIRALSSSRCEITVRNPTILRPKQLSRQMLQFDDTTRLRFIAEVFNQLRSDGVLVRYQGLRAVTNMAVFVTLDTSDEPNGIMMFPGDFVTEGEIIGFADELPYLLPGRTDSTADRVK